MKNQFVLIYWKDASMHGTEQRTRDEIKEKFGLIKGISGGILANEDKEQITIALDWFHGQDDFRQIASYPKSGIYKLRRYYFGDRKAMGVSKTKGGKSNQHDTITSLKSK